ncbi:Mitotic checkpoint serine/threonine-protein kinase BUB1 beta [Nymphon striatum]|nr:Mitotic checkpoint serine/threonine-protein kinase BUB1 beta [Nymphon striatum]
MSWELSKENIQPLPQGRKMSNLQAALKSQPKELLATKRHEFEVELRTYSGDDPLDVWYRYINWVQQNYPSGGKESGLLEICKKVFYRFYAEEKYKNDERFIQMWIIYICQGLYESHDRSKTAIKIEGAALVEQ